MWIEELADKLKEHNQKIDKVHTQTEQKIEQLKELYLERERMIDELLGDNNNE